MTISINGVNQAVPSREDYGRAVQDIAELKAISPSERFDILNVNVEDELRSYWFDLQSAAVESLPSVAIPNDLPATGRWIRLPPEGGGVPAAHGSTHKGDGSDPEPVATGAVSGDMSAADKAKLDGIGAGANVTSVHGRTGVVVSVVGDYDHAEILGLGPNDHHPQAHPMGSGDHVADSFVALDAKVNDEVLFKQSDVAGSTLVGRVRRTGATAFATVKDATAEAADPLVTSDAAAGYEVGSIWLNTTDDRSFICIDSTNGAAIWLRTGQAILKSFQFFADQFENPVNMDWIVNALAPAIPDSINTNKIVRAFDDIAEEGVGFTIRIPAGAKSMILKPVGRALTGPPGSRTVGLKLYQQGDPDNASQDGWAAAIQLADIDIPVTTDFYQYDSETLSLATISVNADEITHFELTRDPTPVGGTNLVGDWLLLMLGVDFI